LYAQKIMVMTKADIVQNIANQTGLDKRDVQKVVELFMNEVKDSLNHGENVYLRGFGTFAVKKRARKKARNISKNETVIVPERFVPAFKPSKSFVESVKNNVKP